MSTAYRIRQGIRALGAWLRPADDSLAQQYLSPPLFALFRQMRRSERQHSLRVLQALLADHHTHPDLFAAALLHDVGKMRTYFFLPEKVLVVLIRAIFPHTYQRWGSGSARGWRRPFAVSVQHPAWGAEMVTAAGGSILVAELIRHHADPVEGDPQTETDRLLRTLQAVDDQN
ncbi:MAG: HD domain-containing protein [Chloroflexi bacterium]|nr:HD domain-containing protein [Chloroflexota bacterium]